MSKSSWSELNWSLQEKPVVQEEFLWSLNVFVSCLFTQRTSGMRSGGCWSRPPVASSNPRVATAVGCTGCRSRRRGGVFVAGVIAFLFVEAQADVALQGCWGQPLLGEAALQEGDAGAEVGQSVDPTGDFSPTEQLQEGAENVWDHKKGSRLYSKTPLSWKHLRVVWLQRARRRSGCSFCASGGRRCLEILCPVPPWFYRCPPPWSL